MNIDIDLLNVYSCVYQEMFCSEIILKLKLEQDYVELLLTILCSVDLLDYGTSPRGSFINDEYDFETTYQLMKDDIIERWELNDDKDELQEFLDSLV